MQKEGVTADPWGPLPRYHTRNGLLCSESILSSSGEKWARPSQVRKSITRDLPAPTNCRGPMLLFGTISWPYWKLTYLRRQRYEITLLITDVFERWYSLACFLHKRRPFQLGILYASRSTVSGASSELVASHRVKIHSGWKADMEEQEDRLLRCWSFCWIYLRS